MEIIIDTEKREIKNRKIEDQLLDTLITFSTDYGLTTQEIVGIIEITKLRILESEEDE